jgi:hypothetical protein
MFHAMEVLHKLGVKEVILVYTRFEEETNLENFDVMLVPAQQNKLRVLKKFFHDRCRRVSAEVRKRREAQLGDVLHDHVVNLQEQALREIERWTEQGKGMYQHQAITRIWLSNSVRYQRGVTSRDEMRFVRGWKAPKFRFMEARPVAWVQGRISKPRIWVEE